MANQHNVPDSSTGELLNVRAVAELLNCSATHVWQLVDLGNMPAPLRIGALLRWRRQIVERWLAAGRPRVRKAKHD